MERIRRPAVAGSFYPGDPVELDAVVSRYLLTAQQDIASADDAVSFPKALIVPHAGFVYSGAVAASAYARLGEVARRVRRVVLLGPSHRVYLMGLAASSAEFFETPLGALAVDREAVERALALPQVQLADGPHLHEHSLEVQLPFLQRVLDDFVLVPFSVGDASTAEVAELLELLWGGEETLIVVSSDLSHYLDYETARRCDATTSRAIEALEPEKLESESACGRVPVRGLLAAARRHGLRAHAVDLRNSGDTAGPRDRVVGYGAYVLG